MQKKEKPENRNFRSTLTEPYIARKTSVFISQKGLLAHFTGLQHFHRSISSKIRLDFEAQLVDLNPVYMKRMAYSTFDRLSKSLSYSYIDPQRSALGKGRVRYTSFESLGASASICKDLYING